ncbi:LytTR family two component transcriptional regulator [Kineothrix alysoides]|uniref:Stage 0 sporulation protein A homolog n=1 Tax=Kineothrix alysoides TaxID=1469948 RepID=A0A4R1QVW2_9FIRM|nr:LytTR family DNA-binding domain-containing protein [Kineothrix alysoides]TCL57311.1 LytTR family two component transcriptional regulator [Kineothrix alysoides]
MIKIAVVDDEQMERDTLKRYYLDLQQEICEELEVLLYSSGEDLLDNYDYSFDMICLDIDLPGKDGISMAKELRKTDEQVILLFVTNMAQMAVKGYEVQALDFIVKPVNYYSFAMKMKNAINIINNKKHKNIIISTPRGFQKVSTSELYYVEVRGHYLYYHTLNGVFRQKASLKELEGNLTGLSFKRCNNCYLVNLRYIDLVDKDELQIAGEWLKISRPRKKEFLQSLANYLGGIRL